MFWAVSISHFIVVRNFYLLHFFIVFWLTFVHKLLYFCLLLYTALVHATFQLCTTDVSVVSFDLTAHCFCCSSQMKPPLHFLKLSCGFVVAFTCFIPFWVDNTRTCHNPFSCNLFACKIVACGLGFYNPYLSLISFERFIYILVHTSSFKVFFIYVNFFVLKVSYQSLGDSFVSLLVLALIAVWSETSCFDIMNGETNYTSTDIFWLIYITMSVCLYICG